MEIRSLRPLKGAHCAECAEQRVEFDRYMAESGVFDIAEETKKRGVFDVLSVFLDVALVILVGFLGLQLGVILSRVPLWTLALGRAAQ